MFFGRARARSTSASENPLQLALWSGRDAVPGWNVRISRRARRLSMRVFPGGRVEVVVPPGVGIPAIERFVSSHRAWAERRSSELQLQAATQGDRRPETVTLGLLERTWRVEYQSGRRNRVEAVGDDVLRIQTQTETDRHVSQGLLRWVTDVATVDLAARLAAVSGETGIDYARLQLRRQRTRWGSCSATGTLSLNLCLMFQAPPVVRYLMIHELCHRRHMNHSRRYWSLVESLEPNWRALDAELLKGWRNVPAWVFPAV